MVEFVHANSAAKFGIQLGHAGRKGSTKLAWEGIDQPLESGNWPLISASPLPYLKDSQVPKAMDRADMDRVHAGLRARDRTGRRHRRDWLELHCAHGYLLSSFLSPLTNLRDDDYGGGHENRARFPLEVFRAIRAVWPADKPISVRLSCHDWTDGGNTPEDAAIFARDVQGSRRRPDRLLVRPGVEGGAAGLWPPVPDAVLRQDPQRDPAFRPSRSARSPRPITPTPSSLPAVPICAPIARPHLADPAWTLHEAAKIGLTDIAWPKQYRIGQDAVRDQPRPRGRRSRW